MSFRPKRARLTPLALAALMALGASSLNAAPRTFTGGSSFWDVVSNWSGGILPGAGDDAILGAFNTEIRTSFTINSFVGTGSLTASAGTLSFGAASSIGSLNLTGSTLTGTGSLQVAGASTWTTGAMSGTGVTTFNGNLDISGTGLKDITNGRTVNFNGTTTWSTTSAANGRIRTGSTATLNNNGIWLDQNAFTNSITQDFGGPASTFVNAGVYTKSGAATTTIGIGFNNTSSGAGTGVVNLNAGSLLLTGGGTSNGSFVGAAGTAFGFGGNHTLQAASSINTAGSVDFSSGINTVAGSFNATAGTTFSGGTTTFTGNVAGVGPAITANGGIGVFSNGQAINTSSLVLTSAGGGLAFNNTGGVTANGLTLSGGTLSGTSAVVVNGPSTWDGGTMTGTGSTTFNTNLALTTAALKDVTNGRTVNFNGTTTWSTPTAGQGRIRTGSTATLVNNGTWLDQNTLTNSITQDFGGPASSFVNAGSYTKSGAATTTIGIGFNNTSSGAGTGVVNLNAGSLLLTGGGTSNGSFVGVAGTTFVFGGNHTLQAASSINTAGSVDFNGGTNTVAGSYNAATATSFSGGTTTFTGNVSGVGPTITANGGIGVFSNGQAFNASSLVLTTAGGGLTFSNTGGVTTNALTLSGGTLAGTSAVVVNGPSTWDGGTMTGTGSTTFNTNLALTTAALKDVTLGRTVNFNGTTTWSTPSAGSGRIRTGSTATLNNNGTWLDQNAINNSITQDFGGPASTFVNAGTYTKSGAATTNIGITFNNTSSGAGTGVVNVNAGTLQLSGGGTSNGSFAGAGTLEFSGGTHTLQAASSVTNGNVTFSGGTINLAGSYNTSGTTAFTGGTANFTGTVANSGGALTFNASGGTANFSNGAGVQFSSLNMQAGTIGGTQGVSFTGPSTWSAGTMTGTGTTTFAGDVALNTNGLKDITNGRVVNFNATTTWTNATAANGRIRTGSTVTLNNNGIWLDQSAFANQISQDFGGPVSTFVNAGAYTKSGAAVTAIDIGFNNTSTGEGTGVVNVNAGTLQLGGGGTSNGSFAGAGTLQFSGGTHTLQAASSITNPNVTFSGGTTTLAGTYNASGTTAFTGGTANFTGTVANSGGALTFNASGGTANFSNSAGVQFSSLNMQNGTIGGTQTVTFTGPSTWAGGTMTGAGTTTFAGDVALNTNGLKDITNGRVVNFNGTTTWTNATAANGRIRTGSTVTLNNNGTWLDQSAFANQISQDLGGSASTFVNAGAYTKSAAAVTAIDIGFNNTGVVNVNAGTLQLGGGGTSSGSFAGAGLLVFSGGIHALTAASSVGNANVTFSGGTTTLAGAYNASGTTAFTGGTANFTGTVANSGGALTFNAGGGTANFSNSAGVQFASLTMPAGTIGGTQAVTFTGPSTWTTGTMLGAGSTTFAGDLAVSTNGSKDILNGRTVNFNGTTTWTNASANGGQFRTGGGATLNNNGTWLDQNAFNNDISNQFGGAVSTFANAGTYTKSGASITRFGVGFNNAAAGTVNVNAGNLELNGGGTNAGAINIAGGSALIFAGLDYTLGGTLSSPASGRLLAASGTVTNTSIKSFGGQLEIVGGTFSTSAAFTAASYLQSAGTVTGSGTLAVTGPATWTTGTMTGVGTTSFSGDLAVNTNGLKDITNGRTVNFNGTTTWSNTVVNGGQFRTGTTATLNNNGTWLDQNAFNNDISQQFGGPASTFANAGTYTKSGASITRFGIGFNNAAAGTVNVNAGNLELNGGGSNAGAINIAGGSALIFAGLDYTLGGTLSTAASGRLLAANGTVTNTNVKNFGGQLEIVGGTFSTSAAFTAASYLQSAGTVTGSGTLAVTGPATWTTGTMTGVGTTTFAGDLAVNTNGLKDITNSRTVNFNGTTTWSNTVVNGGQFRTGTTATLNNNGTWLDQNAFNNDISQQFGGPASTFANAGTYTKSGASITRFGIGFNNAAAGTVNVNAGNLEFNGGGSNAGAINIASGSALIFAGSDYTLGGTLSSTASGRLRAANGTVTNTNVKNFGGQLEVVGGTFSTSAAFNAASYLQSSGIVTGPGTLTVTGPATWTTGTMNGAGTTTFAGALALSTDGLKDITNGRTVNFNGTTTWTNGSPGSGIRTGSAATLNNNGTWLDQNAFSNSFRQDFGGPESTFVNAGTYIKTGALTNIAIAFDNTGTVNVDAGTLQINSSGSLRNFSGTTLTGGNFNVTGASTFSFPGANVVTNAAGITLDGAGSQFLNSSTLATGLANFATNTAAGSFTIRNGRNFTTAGNFGNAGLVSVGSGSAFTTAGAGNFTNQTGGTLQMAGGSFAAGTLANAGTVNGFGTVTPAISNSGLLRATGGTLVASSGVLGATGTVTIDGGATLNLSSSGVASTARVLAQNGNLNLGTQNITVFKDYSNANFASGNSFAARAGVSGTGLIQGQNASQTLTGQVVAGGANAFTVDFGNVRGGTTVTRTFQIANNGTGADIRGALQTGGPGLGNLTDARLSGTGAVAANFGPILFGTNGGDLGITLDAAGAGGALSGQSFAVVSNFSNVATQTVALSGFTTVLAQGAATPGGPLNLGNFRVGVPPAVSTNLAVSNTTTGAGAEQLGIGSASATGNFSASNNLGAGLVAAGATATNAVTVASAGGTVGVNNGNVTLQFVSNGQAFDASFTNLATNQQTLAVQATGFLQAQPALPANVAVGNYRLTTGASSAFTLTNTNLAPAGFQEVLNATSGSTTAGVTLQGSVAGLAAGASSNNFVIGFAAGGAAGARSGSANVTLVSDGTGTSGLGLLGLNNGVVGITGTAFNVAVGATTPSPVVVGNQRLNGVGGGTASVALNVANTAAAGSFSEALNASFSSITGQATTNGGSFTNLAAGGSNNSAMVVSVNNTQAGNRSGSVTLGYQTSGTGSNGNSGLAAVAAGTQTVNVSGNVFRLATASAASPAALVFANVRQGTGTLQTFTLTNTALADGFSEGLNASIVATSGFSASGSFAVLAAGASSAALGVSMDTTTAGARTGTATITLASDGSATGNSGFGALGIGTQVVNLSGGVFRLATASAATPNPVALANQRVGGTLSQLITIGNTAAADGFSEGLNATITASGAATAAGSFSLLAAGASSNALSVGLSTGTAGAKSGTATVTLASDGTGTSGFAAFGIGTQTVSVTGNVFRLASASSVTPASVTLADQRVGGSLFQSLTLANTAAADGFSEGLNASITASGTASAAGSFSLLAAGASSNALSVGVSTGTAGAKSGTATITLASDGTGTSGFAAFGLNSQTVNVSGNVFRLAQPVVDTTPLVMIARVGDAALSRNIGVNNNAPDLFTERLNASIGSSPAGTSAGPALLGLTPNASGNLQLSLPTTTAGSFSGPVSVALVSSSAGTSSGAPDFSLGSVNVGLTGRVYAPAVAQVAPTVVDFGTVRVGDVVSARTVTVANTATGALTDTLRATLSGGGAPFTTSGTVTGLAAGASNSTGLQVQLATTSAGVFSGLASVATTSQNPDLADLTLTPAAITLQGQVNNLAQVVLAKSGGNGSFSGTAFNYTLDFGTVLSGGSSLTAQLVLGNAAAGTADALAGSWNLGTGGAFGVAGFGPFSGLAAGATLAGLTVTFDLGTEGSFDRVLVLNSLSTNGSGPDLALGDISLRLQGSVVAVPEPSTYLMMLVGALTIGSLARRRLRARQG